MTGVLKSLLFLGRLEEIDRYKSLLLRYTSNIHEKLEVLTALMELGFAFTDEQLGSVCMQLVDVEVINWQILVRWSNQKGEDSERIGRIFRETKGLKQVSLFFLVPSLGGDTHRVCDSWSEGFESCVCWLLRCGHIPVVLAGSKTWWCANCLWLRSPKRALGVCRKEYGIVSRLRVSVCRRYVHDNDERRS